MTVTETLIDGDPEKYEQRYSVRLTPTANLRMVRRPLAIPAAEGTVAWVDNGERHGVIPKSSAGVFKDGEWKQTKFSPTHWVTLDV